jgi:hypothetical protein
VITNLANNFPVFLTPHSWEKKSTDVEERENFFFLRLTRLWRKLAVGPPLYYLLPKYIKNGWITFDDIYSYGTGRIGKKTYRSHWIEGRRILRRLLKWHQCVSIIVFLAGMVKRAIRVHCVWYFKFRRLPVETRWGEKEKNWLARNCLVSFWSSFCSFLPCRCYAFNNGLYLCNLWSVNSRYVFYKKFKFKVFSFVSI